MFILHFRADVGTGLIVVLGVRHRTVPSAHNPAVHGSGLGTGDARRFVQCVHGLLLHTPEQRALPAHDADDIFSVAAAGVGVGWQARLIIGHFHGLCLLFRFWPLVRHTGGKRRVFLFPAAHSMSHHLRRHRVVDALNRRAAGSLILRMRRAECVKACIAQALQQRVLGHAQTLGADSQLAAGVGAVPKPGLHPGQILRCHQQICLASAVAGMRLSRPAPIQPSKLRQTLRAA